MYDFYMENNIKNKLYQMFVLGMEGSDLDKNPNLINAITKGLGGVIFFTQNIQTKEGIKKLTSDIRQVVNGSDSLPLFLAIDQEGGRVERTENLFGGKKFLSAKFAVQNDPEFLKEQTVKISHLLNDMGINLNFAPVLDVNTNSNNPIIGERAFSDDPDEVIKYGKIVVNTYLENGIIPCAKHFPGHGDASVDSHLGLPEINLSMDVLENIHIKPFKEVFAPMIMIAHLHCKAFDEEKIPSSLSKNVIGYLRSNLNYDGLIITDDMIMGGVIDIEPVEACSEAIKAGVNILLYRDSFDSTIQIIDDLIAVVENDPELQECVNLSFNKIKKYKKKYIKF